MQEMKPKLLIFGFYVFRTLFPQEGSHKVAAKILSPYELKSNFFFIDNVDDQNGVQRPRSHLGAS